MSKNDKEEIVVEEVTIPVPEPEVISEPVAEPVKVEITGVDAPKK